MPFRRQPGQPRDLKVLIEIELRERIAEAADAVAVEAVVARRRARGLPPPAAGDADARREFAACVREFLDRLAAELLRQVTPEQRRSAAAAAAGAGDARLGRISRQVVLARELPDYWQRFDAIRHAYVAEVERSGGQGCGVVRRFLAR